MQTTQSYFGLIERSETPSERVCSRCRRVCRPSSSRRARWFLCSGLPRAGSQRTSRASSPGSGRPARPPSRRPLRPCVAFPACPSSHSAALTRAPRRLRGVRAGSAYQPPALCTYRRRRAACPQGPTSCVLALGVPARAAPRGTPGAGRSRGRDAQLGSGLVEHPAPARWPRLQAQPDQAAGAAAAAAVRRPRRIPHEAQDLRPNPNPNPNPRRARWRGC